MLHTSYEHSDYQSIGILEEKIGQEVYDRREI